MAITVIKSQDTAVTLTGTWTFAANGTVANAGIPGYSLNFGYSQCTGDNTPTATAKLVFTGLTPGTTYMVAWSIPSGSNRADDQYYKVLDSNGSTVLWSGNISGRATFTDFTYATGAGNASPGSPGFIWLGRFTPAGTSLTIYTDNTGALNNKFAILDAAYLQLTTDSYTPVYAIRQGGTWSDTTPSSAGVPGSPWRTGDVPPTSNAVALGDAFIVTPGITTITAASNLIQGPTGTAGTAAITTGQNVSLVVADGVTMGVLGDIVLADTRASRQSGLFPVQVGTGSTGGAILEFDGTASTAKYRIRPSSDLQANAFIKLRGISGNNAVIRSKSGSPNAWISYNSQRGMSVDSQFGTFLRMGDGTNPSLSVYPSTSAYTLSLVDTTFDACGPVTLNGSPVYVTMTRVLFQNSVQSTCHTTVAGGLNAYTDCTFDKPVNAYGMTNTTFTGCKFIGPPGFLSPYTFAGFSDNFINCQSNQAGVANSTDNYYFYDVGTDTNPHPHLIANASTITGAIFDCPGGTIGDMIVGGAGSGNLTIATYCIVLPNLYGTSPGELCSAIAAGLWKYNHNTVTSTSAQSGNAETGGGACGETFSGSAGMFQEIYSNLIYSPTGKGAILLRHVTATVGDVIANTGGNLNADYNCGNNLVTATGSGVVAVYGPQGGYIDVASDRTGAVAMFSSTTGLGVHDITANPQFVDTTRNFATFDSAYLGNTATAWSTGVAYSVGDFASVSDPLLYGGATVNFRCINAHTSNAGNSTNGKPGLDATVTSWRTNWEWATYYRFRTTAVSYNASIRQATKKDLGLWVKAGFAPTNVTLRNAGHDGVTIGAVECVAAGASSSGQFDVIRPGDLTPIGGRAERVRAGDGLVAGVPLPKIDAQGYFFVSRIPATGSPLATGLSFGLVMVDDPLNADPGKVIRLGVTVKRLASGSDTFSTSTGAATEQTVDVTMSATAGVYTLAGLDVANADLDSLTASDAYAVRIRRIGSSSADTHRGRGVLMGVVVRDT